MKRYARNAISTCWNEFAMARVLVTYGWCRTAYVAVKSLARSNHVVFSSSHLTPSMSGWSRFCAGSAKTADAAKNPKQFVADLCCLIQEWDIEVLMPCHEDALAVREFQHCLPNKVIVACPALEQLRVGVDKLSITRVAESINVPVPMTSAPKKRDISLAAEKIGYPLVIKLSRSNSAKGVYAMRSKAELHEFLRQRRGEEALEEEFYLQRFHKGAIVGICFFAREGEVEKCFSEKYIRAKDGKFGTSVFRIPYYSRLLEEYARRLVRALGWTGIGHFDFIELEDVDDFVLLEMNPRPWGAINLAYVNGYDFLSALVAHSLGEMELHPYFQNSCGSENRRGLWIVGETIRFVSLLTQKNIGAAARFPFEILSSLRNTKYDDFVISDPLPLAAEFLCYGKGFVCSGGSVNPD